MRTHLGVVLFSILLVLVGFGADSALPVGLLRRIHDGAVCVCSVGIKEGC